MTNQCKTSWLDIFCTCKYTKIIKYFSIFIFVTGLQILTAQNARIPFDTRANYNIHGNIEIIGNSIVGLKEDAQGNLFNPNAPYNGSLNNGNNISAYINVDEEDNIFSSSSAGLAINNPDCSRILYAGLYWAATYYIESQEEGIAQRVNLPLVDARKQGSADFRNIQFKAPNGDYNSVRAQEVIFDGYANTATNQMQDVNDIDQDGDVQELIASDDVPYVCYAEITQLIDQDNINGDYFVANMNATTGFTSTTDGATGGWTLVIIYENPEESPMSITTIDGFEEISINNNVIDYVFSDVRIPPGLAPVNASFGIAALEGDKALYGDQLQILDVSGNYVNLGNGAVNNNDVNPTRNFFNSSISKNNEYITNRNPNSENTLGFDIDFFQLDNNSGYLLGNNQSSVDFRLTTERDAYRVFFNALIIENFEPDLSIILEAYNDAGVNITDNTTNLGETIRYNLTVENVGNENFVDGSVFITSAIPEKTNFIDISFLPAGIAFKEIESGLLEFSIPSDLIETEDHPISISYQIQTQSDCQEFKDVCSNEIANSAFGRAIGDITSQSISVMSTSYKSKCSLSEGAATKFFVESTVCSTDVFSCGSSISLTAGQGYDEYTWVGPGINTPIKTSSNIFIIEAPKNGIYTVVKEVIDGACETTAEEFKITGADLSIDTIEITPVSEDANGTIVVQAFGGTSPYTYELLEVTGAPLFPRQTSNTFSINEPGNYYAVVYDANGCDQIQSITVESTGQNPLLDYAQEILFCTLTGQSYPLVVIEDQNGTALDVSTLQTVSVLWQKLDTIRCDVELQENCPTDDSSCSSDWFTLCATADCIITDPGEYRVIIEFANKSLLNTQVYYFRATRTLGTNSVTSANFEIYPNPAKETLHIRSNEGTIKTVTIMDLTGKTVLRANQHTFDISDLNQGVYFVVMEQKNKKSVLKLIKE